MERIPTPACATSILPGSLLAWAISSATELTLSLLEIVRPARWAKGGERHRREIFCRIEWGVSC